MVCCVAVDDPAVWRNFKQTWFCYSCISLRTYTSIFVIQELLKLCFWDSSQHQLPIIFVCTIRNLISHRSILVAVKIGTCSYLWVPWRISVQLITLLDKVSHFPTIGALRSPSGRSWTTFVLIKPSWILWTAVEDFWTIWPCVSSKVVLHLIAPYGHGSAGVRLCSCVCRTKKPLFFFLAHRGICLTDRGKRIHEKYLPTNCTVGFIQSH